LNGPLAREAEISPSGAVTESAGPTRELPRSLVSVAPCEGNAGATKKSLLVHSVLEACAARGIAAIGTLNEGALHAQLKDWYRRRGDRVEQLVDGFVVDLVRGELLVEIQTGSFAPLRASWGSSRRAIACALLRPSRSSAGSSG